jgi:FecR protein
MKINHPALKPFLKPAIALVAIVAIAAIAWSLFSHPKPAQFQAMKVSWTQGSVLFSVGGAAWEYADPGTDLYAGATLRTGDNSKAILQTPEGSYVRLDSNTELKILVMNGTSVRLAQDSGRSFVRIKTPDKPLFQLDALGNTLKDANAFDTTVNPTDQRINSKAIEGALTIAYADPTISGPTSIPSGKEITVVTAPPASATLLDTGADYLNSDWFKWNQGEDQKIGYSLNPQAQPSATPSSPTPAPSAPSTPSTPHPSTSPSPAKTQTAPYTSTASCKPNLTIKSGFNGLGFQLNWSTCDSADFQYYKLVRSTNNPNLSFPSTPALVTSSNKFFGAYLDRGLAIGQTYYYRVCVVERLSKVGCGNVVKRTN